MSSPYSASFKSRMVGRLIGPQAISANALAQGAIVGRCVNKAKGGDYLLG
jgi:hypothetical protein